MISRHELIWGKEGQELIQNAKIAITGLDNAGLELFKSAAMLGIGKVYLADNETYKEGIFLDIPLKSDKPRAEQLESFFNKESKNYQKELTNFLTEVKYVPRQWNLPSVDAVFDMTNSPKSQMNTIELSKEKGIDAYLGGCDLGSFEFKYFFPNSKEWISSSFDNIADAMEISRYECKNQGIIISHLLSSIAVECMRKRLFEKDKKVAEKVGILDLNHFKQGVNYSLISRMSTETPSELQSEAQFSGSSILICGCGAIGNPVADMLARLGAKKITVIDYDTVERTNLERQPLYYDCIGRCKSEALAEKICKINPKVSCKHYFKKIGDKDGELGLKWFDENRHDIILGCFDSAPARAAVNRYATTLGMKYIDGGSEPDAGDVVPFVPGKTACLDCALRIETRAKAAPDPVSCSDIRVTGNVNMSNRAVAAIMLGEALKIANPALGEVFPGIVTYVNRGKGFNLQTIKPQCNKCKNDPK